MNLLQIPLPTRWCHSARSRLRNGRIHPLVLKHPDVLCSVDLVYLAEILSPVLVLVVPVAVLVVLVAILLVLVVVVCVCVCACFGRAQQTTEKYNERERERENQPRRKKRRERERDVPQPPIYGSIGLMSVIRLTTTICNPISVRCPLSAVRCLSLSLSVCCCASVLIVLLLVRFHVPCCAFLFCFHFACTTKHDEPKAKV